MSGFRSYCDFPELPRISGAVELSADESRHLCGALRARAGDSVDVFDLRGNIFRCEISEADARRARLKVVSKIEPKPRRNRIYLLQCLPKGGTFDTIIRQCVEIGAAGIYPIISQFSQVKIDPRDAEKKRAKWRAQVVEAVKQSSNFSGFDIFAPAAFGSFFDALPAFDLKITASLEPGAARLGDIFAAAPEPESVALLVGPEGDLSPAEYARARAAGFKPATLGENVLKCETAAISCVARAMEALNFARPLGAEQKGAGIV